MSKAIQGAAELAGAVAMGVAAFVNPTLLANPWFMRAWVGLIATGISSEMGAIAQALTTNRGVQITDRRPASNRTIIYGTQMVGGTLVYESVTGHQYNQIIVIAGHAIHSIQGIFLDGRKVIFKGSGNGWSVRNGVGFGGDASDSDQIGPDGVTHYNFGGKVYVEARYGDQATGDVMGSMTGNDPVWAYNGTTGDAPSLQGCAYIYLKCVASTTQFPQRPEVKILVNGKSDILDPRTGSRGFTNNNALVLADVITDTQFGLGDDNVDQTQLIAAANICDEQVAVAALSGTTESRYCCDYSYDTGTAPADVMATMLAGMAGRISYVGGKWFIFPGAYVGPSMSFDASALTASVQWNPARSVRDLPNRVTGTHISAEYPYSVAGNYYQNRQTVQNNFDLKFTQSSYPYYAQDVRHGYPNDEWLNEDNGHIRPMELGLPTVLSLTQCQRVAKINLLRARARQGTGTLEMHLAAYKLQPCDALNFTFSQLGWDNEVLEITGTTLKVDKVSTDEGEAYSVRYTLNVQQTDPSIYAWSTSEELTIYAAPAAPTQTPLVPNPPTNLQLSSGAQTAIVGQDGSVTPVIQVTWDTPLDNAATGIAIQYRQTGTGTWFYAPTADISLNVGLISTVIAGAHYDVRIATLRANGALSSWVEQDNFLVPTLSSFLGQLSAQWPNGANLPAPGADVTAQQPLAYAGTSNNLIANGNFLLGTDVGWYKNGSTSFDSTPQLFVAAGSTIWSPTFAVQPGNKYRFIFDCQSVSQPCAGEHRIMTASVYSPNIVDIIGVPGLIENVLLASVTVNTRNSFVYDWVCPAGTYFASLVAFNSSSAPNAVACFRMVAQDYSAAAQWGADHTGSNTSNDTSYVSGVPSSTIASVVPTGYKLIINSGAKTYSIEAI